MAKHPLSDEALLSLLDGLDQVMPETPPPGVLLADLRARRRLDATLGRHELTGMLHWERVCRNLTGWLMRTT